MLRAVAACLDRLVLMVLDDLHWSDEATLELLSALAHPLGELSVPRHRGVSLRRADRATTGCAACATSCGAPRRLDELVLGPLEPGDVAQLLAATLDARPRRRSSRRSTTRPRERRSSSRSSPRCCGERFAAGGSYRGRG